MLHFITCLDKIDQIFVLTRIWIHYVLPFLKEIIIILIDNVLVKLIVHVAFFGTSEGNCSCEEKPLL